MAASNRNFFLAAAIAALFLIAVVFAASVAVTPALLLFDGDGRKLEAIPLEKGIFVHRYTHSVHKTPVDEEFIISGKKLELVRLKYDSYGIGMPSDAGDSFRIEGNRFVVDMSRSFTRLDIRVSHLPGHGLLIDGEFRPFTEWVPAESLITLKAGKSITFSPRRKAHL